MPADLIPGPGQGGPAMRRAILSVGLFILVTLAAVGLAQPPAPTPPQMPPRTLPPSLTPPVTPAGGAVPAARTVGETPLSRFEPLAAYPMPTQHAIRSVLLAAGWM